MTCQCRPPHLQTPGSHSNSHSPCRTRGCSRWCRISCGRGLPQTVAVFGCWWYHWYRDWGPYCLHLWYGFWWFFHYPGREFLFFSFCNRFFCDRFVWVFYQSCRQWIYWILWYFLAMNILKDLHEISLISCMTVAHIYDVYFSCLMTQNFLDYL